MRWEEREGNIPAERIIVNRDVEEDAWPDHGWLGDLSLCFFLVARHSRRRVSSCCGLNAVESRL